jgi:hypothetical protein
MDSRCAIRCATGNDPAHGRRNDPALVRDGITLAAIEILFKIKYLWF